MGGFLTVTGDNPILARVSGLS
ncbi:hypothetical protein CBM2595_A30579 [Cupriavidus taiwanensis]|nr:hypothetical protein CBM2595_A30579 [Cupriavidus taiwanensis]